MGMQELFDQLSDFTSYVASSEIKSLIVSGPAGWGKTHIVKTVLENECVEYENILEGRYTKKFKIFSGFMKPIHLYKNLYECRNRGMVAVFDDTDNILKDNDSLNLLKAALDSHEAKEITYSSEAHLLKEHYIPNSFVFEGSVIFITNVDLLSSKNEHLKALTSRSFYLDVNFKYDHDKTDWLIYSIRNTSILNEFNINETDTLELIEFVVSLEGNQNIDLRTIKKVAKLIKLRPHDWRESAETVLRLY